MDGDSTVFAVLHHMHLTGVHMTTKAIPASGAPTILHDAPYVFDQQKYVVLDPPARLQQSDKLEITCTYENPGTETLTFGESTEKAEMCITAAYRYPAIAANFNCLQ